MSELWLPDGVDPSRIEINLDPRDNRMTGVARHGLVPFDVPYISHVDGNLWQGGCATGLELPTEIQHVISLYPWETYTIRHELKSMLVVTMYDSLEQGLEQVDAIAAWVNVCRKDAPTLVHCQAGLNRSSLITARALILDGMAAPAAIALLREKRSPAVLCNGAFEEWLVAVSA